MKTCLIHFLGGYTEDEIIVSEVQGYVKGKESMTKHLRHLGYDVDKVDRLYKLTEVNK